MAKFNSRTPTVSRPRRTISPVRTTGARTFTHNMAEGFVRDAESELFLLAATNMVGENTFYESAMQRDQRYASLIAQVTQTNPTWIAGSDTRQGFASFLRENMFMRSASIVMAAEYVRAGGPNGRAVVNKVLQRPDEPAEILGYWLSTYGKPIPKAIQRGVADSLQRLYTQKNAVKYDGQGQNIRFGDVIDIVHPRPKNEEQSALFKYLLDKRHDHVNMDWVGYTLRMISSDHRLITFDGDRRELVRQNPELLAQAGWNWERLAGWLPGGMDAEAWEFAIPQMGYMALLRNLRNFDEKNVSDAVKNRIAATLQDPEQVAKSRQFPFRFWSAYKNAPSANWVLALERALDASTGNIPALDGDTEIYIDVSGSMDTTVSNKSTMSRWEVGAVMALSTWKRSGGKTKIVLYGTNSMELALPSSTSVLRGVEEIARIVRGGKLGWSTNAWQTISRHYGGGKRVVIFTDEQCNPGSTSVQERIPVIYTYNLAGYAPAMMEGGKAGRHTFGGFSDASFTLMKVLEDNKNGTWPF